MFVDKFEILWKNLLVFDWKDLVMLLVGALLIFLAIKKERQKEFLSHFALALKALGFKKKGTKWTRILNSGKALTFDAQKSAFSDQYYFNVTVHEASNLYATHSYERVVMYGSDIYNWQLMTQNQIENLIQYALKNYIEPKLK